MHCHLTPAFLPIPSISSRLPRVRQAPALVRLCASQPPGPLPGVRINKCFKQSFSRREADALVAAGRVTVNGQTATAGTRVLAGDEVCLDGDSVDWQPLAVPSVDSGYVYIKHWKQPGVVCTTDLRIPNNVLDRIHGFDGHRLFPVGRLDEASSGLLLLTSDGRLPSVLLGSRNECTKEYLITPDQTISDEDLDRMRNGVVIKTVAQRDRGVRKPLVAPTLPCEAERRADIDSNNRFSKQIIIRIQEGRNRQIRKMMGALGYTTRALHRTAFLGITCKGLQAGGWAHLDETEMAAIRDRLPPPDTTTRGVDPS